MLSLSPNAAPIDGNLTILVVGQRFDDFGDVQCRFGPIAVPARFHHRGAITCVAPPVMALCLDDLPTGTHSRGGNYGRVTQRGSGTPYAGCPYTNIQQSTAAAVEVSFNGVDWTKGSTSHFTWYNRSAVQLHAITPTAGPAAGGTRVTISGDRFFAYGGINVHGAHCQFGAAMGAPITQATVRSYDRLVCHSPPLPPGGKFMQAVFITLNGYTDARTLIGRSEGDADHFGRGGGIGQSGGLLNFRYDLTPQLIASVTPLGSPTRGKSTMLTLTAATRFTDDGGPLCLFGGAAPSRPRSRYRLRLEPPLEVAATVAENGTVLLCRAPALTQLTNRGVRPPGPWCSSFRGETAACTDGAYAADGALAIAVDITLNANASDASGHPVPWLYFAVEPEAQLAQEGGGHILPRGGPIHGGTLVQITGHGLLDYGGVSCFIAQTYREPVIVEATLAGGVSNDAHDDAPLVTRYLVHDARSTAAVAHQAARTVLCRMPPLGALIEPTQAGNGNTTELPTLTQAKVSVSLDGSRHFSRTVDYVYVNVALSRIYPQGGPHEGGTRVTVHGRGFLAFGDEGSARPDPYHHDSRPTDRVTERWVEGWTWAELTMSGYQPGDAKGRSAGVMCTFGRTGHVPGTLISAHALVCQSPTSTNASALSHPAEPTGPLPSTQLRISLNGEATEDSDSSLPWHYYDADLAVSSIDPSVGPASGGTLITITGTFANTGSPFCRFGEQLPPVIGVFSNVSSPAGGGVVAPPVGARVNAIVCASPPWLELRNEPASSRCNDVNEQWWLTSFQCGASSSLSVEVSLSSQYDPGGYSSSGVPFTYHAFLTNPEDILTPNPPPPPPSPPPTPPPPSPPPPRPMDCNECVAGFPCGVCLVPLPTDECALYAPTPESLRPCDDNIGLLQICEGDGECATDRELNNCAPGWDVYRRVSCYPFHGVG